jgi:glycosyltransferase involved in cell wall biosynthesis
MASPKVSVLIPCYNAEKYVGETLRSVFEQTWRDLEVIVVDDGSQDRSVKEIERFAEAGVVLIRQGNAGASAARNRALEASTGDFIQFLDADDLIAPDKIERQMRCLGEYPDHVASCEWGRFQSDPDETKFVAEEVWHDFDPAEFVVSSWLGGGMMPPIAWLTPRAVIDKAGPWNEELSVNDDGEYFTRVLLASWGVKFCKGARCFYRSGSSDSLSGRRDRAALMSAYRAAELSSASLLVHADNATTRRACAWQFQRFAYDAYPDAPDLARLAERRAAELGGSALRPSGGPAFSLVASALGWKLARRMQSMWRKLRLGAPNA